MLTASITLHRKPKDGTNGKDGESVKVIETSVTYAISASAMTPPSEPSDWKAEVQKTTDSKPYLWSRTIVKYSGGASTTTYSVSYNGKDGVNGTSFTPKGTATAFYHQADHNTFTEEGIYLVDIYTTASAEQKLYVITRKADGSISYTFAEIGDGYNVGGHLYVAQKPGWVDFGDIKGTDGLDGKDGKDAIDIVLSPAKLTFTADTNGNPLITSDNNKSMLTVMRGKQDVSRGITDVVVTGMLCNAITSTVNDNRMIFIESISKQEVSVTTSDGTVKKYVPATSGSINISFLLDGVRYTSSLPFTVDVKTVLGGVYSDNEKFYTHYEEITNGLEDKINQVQDDTNDNLTQLSSRIEETASQIKLEVSQQPYAVRNLLPGSSFRRQGEGPYIDPQVRIERNTGKGGVSCLHIATQYGGSGEGGYLGAFWDSTYAPFAASGIPVPSDSVAGQNIPIQSDTDYTLSCWVKADNTDLTFCIEVFEMAAYNSANRGTAHRQTFTVSQIDTWQLVEFTIHGKEITSPYLAVNFWCNAKTTKPLTDGTYPAVNAYICQPMLDAASQYSGWSLSPSDGDYQGGNLLDSTATLIPSDSATSTADKSTPLLQVADSAITLRAYKGVYSVAHVNNTTGTPIELLRWNVENVIQDNHDYILSFLAKGTGSITTYLYRDGTPRLYVESINGDLPQLSAEGAVSIPVTSEWKRYWVHYRLRATAQYPNLPDKLLFRVMPDNDISICQPKLEDGARPTSYTERKTDLVDKASLKKAGIEITTDKIKLYGDKVQVLTRIDGTPEYEEAGMFVNGKLNANLINAKNVVADGIQGNDLDAKDATISNLNVRNVKLTGSFRSPFTKTIDSFDIGYSDNAAMTVSKGNWGTIYSLPWNVEQSGRRVCLVNNLWDGDTTFGSVSIYVPDEAKGYGCRFFENGIAKTELDFYSEMIELMAYGNIEAKSDNDPKSKYLYGWVVLNRVSIVPQAMHFGRQKKVLAYGKVKGTPNDVSINYKTFDGRRNITVSRMIAGMYVIFIPAKNNWFENLNDIFVTLTGVGRCYDGDKVGKSYSKATLLDITEVTQFEPKGYNITVGVSDDETANDGSFNFEISNYRDFDV